MLLNPIKFYNYSLLKNLLTTNLGTGSVLFKDTFSNAQAAPLPALANADTKGVWATVDVENLMSVSGGKLQVPAQASAVWGEEYRRAQPSSGQQYWTRPTGKALVAVCTMNHSTRNQQVPVGWWTNSTLDANSVNAVSTAANTFLAKQNTTNVSDQQAYNASTDYQCAAVWTSWGFLVYVKISSIWHLKWVRFDVQTQAYCGLSSLNSIGTIDDFKIVAVDESLFAASLDISNPSVGNLSNMPDGDFLLYLDNITRPSAGDIFLSYRQKDTQNKWRSRISDSAGNFNVTEFVANSPTARITGSGVVNTDDIVTIARAQTIAAWRNTTALGSAYTSAYNWLREVGLELNSLGTGGAIGRLLAWKARLLDETGLGADVVVNGNFATDTVWAKGTGWTISGGTANKAAGSGSELSQIILTTGQYYEVTFTISNYVAGTINIRLGGTAVITAIPAANGTYTVKGVAGGTTFAISADATFAGSIDNVSCSPIQFTDDSLATALNGVLAA